jgi:hypothetical protein
MRPGCSPEMDSLYSDFLQQASIESQEVSEGSELDYDASDGRRNSSDTTGGI